LERKQKERVICLPDKSQSAKFKVQKSKLKSKNHLTHFEKSHAYHTILFRRNTKHPGKIRPPRLLQFCTLNFAL
jgi:hypothetical protein